MTALCRSASLFVSAGCGIVLLGITGCRTVSTTQPPPPTASCSTTSQNGGSTKTGTATGTIGSNQFTLTYTNSLTASSSVGAVAENQLVLHRGPAGSSGAQTPSLQVDTQIESTGGFQLSATFGAGFQGITQIAFTSSNGTTVQGTVNGRTVSPFAIGTDLKTIQYADGSAIPQSVVDSDVRQALPSLMSAIQGKCSAAPAQPAQSPAGQAAAVSLKGDPSAQAYNPYSSFACLTCMVGCEALDMACWVDAACGAADCGVFYSLCFAGALISCIGSDIKCEGNTAWAFHSLCGYGLPVPSAGPCHMLAQSELSGAPPSSMGPPCCPTFCGTTTSINAGEFCCGAGASCALPPLCCPAGFTGCGTNCCPSGSTCVGGNTCCASGNLCGTSCCASGQTCLGGNTCCDPSNTCGPNCCAAGQQCLQDSTTCCAPAKACGRNNCCTDDEVCGANGTCTTTCPDGSPVCGGVCCAANELCCQVQTSSGTSQPQCVSPNPSRNNDPWCGGNPATTSTQPNPTQIVCNNCSSVQHCGDICTTSGGSTLCSNDWYCQCNNGGNVCGQNCCSATDTCIAATGTCCAAGHAVCNGVCCPNAYSTCDPTTGACAAPSCAAGTTLCGGACCSAGQLCCSGINNAPVCGTPVNVSGLTWCGNNANQIQCFNCPSGQQCAPLYSEKSQTFSEDLYCQTF